MHSAKLSTFEQIILRGKMEGKIEGKIEGRIEQALFVARKLLLKMPHLTDEQIAELSGAETSAVREVRTHLSKYKASSRDRNGEK